MAKRKILAFVFSMCMALTIFPVCAFADDVPKYNTLDEIPEDVNIFRSIRTGTITPRWDDYGERYFEFWEQGFPKVKSLLANGACEVPYFELFLFL